jgi:predicted transcriptional regulator
MTIILPIKSIYTQQILEGTKTYELRRSFPKQKISNILIYETAPISRVVANIKVEQLELNKQDFFDNHHKEIGVSKEEYNSYYHDKEIVCVYKIKSIQKLQESKKIKDFGYKFAPQNFYYIK